MVDDANFETASVVRFLPFGRFFGAEARIARRLKLDVASGDFPPKLLYYLARLYSRVNIKERDERFLILAAFDAQMAKRLPAPALDALLWHLRPIIHDDRSISPLYISESETGRALFALPPEQLAALFVFAYERQVIEHENVSLYSGVQARVHIFFKVLSLALARKPLPLSEAQMIGTLRTMSRDKASNRSWGPGYSPDSLVLTMIEKRLRLAGPSPTIKQAVENVITSFDRVTTARFANNERKERVSFREKLATLLNGAPSAFSFPKTHWGESIAAVVTCQEPGRAKRLWALVAHAHTGKGGQPTAKWLKDEAATASGPDASALADHLLEFVEALLPKQLVASVSAQLPGAPEDPQQQEKLERTVLALVDKHAEAARRLLWLGALLGGAPIATRIERVATNCEKSHQTLFGRSCAVIYNGAVTALAMLPAEQAGASLVNLRRKAKGDQLTTIDKALTKLAEREGISVADFEETAVPDYGLSLAGEAKLPVGTGSACVTLSDGTRVSLAWSDAAGKIRKSPPKPRNDEDKSQVSAARARVKEIGETLKGQAARLERTYLSGRTWRCADWRSTYFDHPLLGHLARAVIWSFEWDGVTRMALPQSDALRDAHGAKLEIPDDAVVRLWHPILSEAETVLAWRKRIVALRLTQPIKQAYREVYALTDAERATGDYSNRFAAHLLRQNQFRALARGRGWRAQLDGGWDGGGHPHAASRHIPERRLIAEFVTVGAAERGEGPAGFEFVATDRVRFLDAKYEYTPLERVPTIVFSEIMRDVDLFVAATSNGPDPEWVDGGRDAIRHHQWMSVNFSDLSETAKTRRAALVELLPMLAIAPRCSLDDRALLVRGKLRKYRIHLGSGSILMAPNSAYLCIVPSARGAANDVRLPFEGDAMLSIILSKAFMLCEDDKIADTSIARQISMR